jgi:hypothetical protein
MRHVVFSVIRRRQLPTGPGAKALGSGFFVAQEVFITCDHVINDPRDPHQPGDSYLLVANLTGNSGQLYSVANPQLGTDLHLFPNLDLAVLRVPRPQGQPYVALEYGDVYEGEDIGVAGYPLPELRSIQGNLQLEALIYRAARGHVTARYTADFDAPLLNVPIVEVNFLFVPGNSGGPVFSAETGRVLGFVRGYRTTKIRETVVTATMIPQLPLGLGNQYIENLNAIYSLTIKLDFVRPTLENFGVTL